VSDSDWTSWVRFPADAQFFSFETETTLALGPSSFLFNGYRR